jgi:hypothetical protein
MQRMASSYKKSAERIRKLPGRVDCSFYLDKEQQRRASAALMRFLQCDRMSSAVFLTNAPLVVHGAGGRFADDVRRETAHLLIPRQYRGVLTLDSDQRQCSSRSPQSCQVFS